MVNMRTYSKLNGDTSSFSLTFGQAIATLFHARAVSSAWESATMALWRSPVRARYGPRSYRPKGQSHRLSFFLSEKYFPMIPSSIKLQNTSLNLVWDDGHKGFSSLRTLRERCPCAGCQGETVLLRTYQPLPQPELPGKYDLKDAQQVGSYALQLTWGDGHATGLYTWETLRALCECPQCHPQS